MKCEATVFHRLKCFGTGISFLANMLVMTPLPAAGCESSAPFARGGSFYMATGIEITSTRGCCVNESLVPPVPILRAGKF
jgi:hypothetical protein